MIRSLKERIFLNMKNYVAPKDEKPKTPTQKRILKRLLVEQKPTHQQQLSKARMKDIELLKKCIAVLNKSKRIE